MMKNTFHLGFIGLGARNCVYARNLREQFGDTIRIDAVCDVNEKKLHDFKERYCHRNTALYKDYVRLVKERHDLDGFLIAPPNYLHEKIAIPFLERGVTILLEKPLAHTRESCMNIARVYNKSASRVTMVFVLRYTPFYRTIMKLLREEKLGKIKVLNADEVVGPVLSSVFFRTWRGKKECTGNLLLEKCCHDLDLINKMLEVDPIRVTAFSSDSSYRAREGYGPQCGACKYNDSCAFSTILWEKEIDAGEDNGEYEYVDFSDDLCVYNDDHDVEDRQSQLIEYDGQILVYFNVTLGGNDTRRTIDIIGTKGRLFGDFRENRILFYKIGSSIPEEIRIEHEKSGHGGGDSVITRSFIRSLEDPNYVPEAGVKDALKSALLSFVCDRSRDENKVIPVDYLDEIQSMRD